MSYGGPTNPYQSPQSAGQVFGESPQAAAAARVKVPAIALLVLAPIHMIGMLIDLGVRIYNAQANNMPFVVEGPGAAEGMMVGMVIGGVVDVAAVLCQFLVAYGALQMLNLKSRQMAVTACILSCIPCISGCCLLGIPFGIWGLVVLNDEAVKRSFES
jgi:hypothetical protein